MLKTLLAAAALVAGLGTTAIAAPAPAPATLAPITLDGATTLGSAADVGVVDVHYRRGHHIHRGHRYGKRAYRRHYRPRSGFSVEFGYRSAPRYRAAPVYRRAPVVSYGARHHAWCEGKYRSYSRHTGTFQPYHGPRRRCNSPYDGI